MSDATKGLKVAPERRCGARATDLATTIRPVPRCQHKPYHDGWHEYEQDGVKVRWLGLSYELTVPTHKAAA